MKRSSIFAFGWGLAACFAADPAPARTEVETADAGATDVRARSYGTSVKEDVPERDDRDRRREVELFWLRPTVGYGSINLTTFEADEENLTGDLIPTRLSGPALGLGAGLRLLFISFGVNGGVTFFPSSSEADAVDETQLWTLDGNVLLHLLSGYQIEPYVQLGAGYQAFGGLGEYSIHGWNVHAGIGLDYFMTDDVSIGGLLSGSLTFMTRPGRSATALLTPEEVETTGQARDRLLEADGSSIGSGFSLVVGPSLHF